jgi:hypothetical protein
VNRSSKFLPKTVGRHRRRTSRFGRTLKVRVVALVAGLATAGAIVAFVPHSAPAHTRSTTTASSVAAPRLTSVELTELRNLTPAQASRLNQALENGFSKLGIKAGLGNPQPATAGEAALTAYDWSGGVSWDHAWVTASYANLAPYVDVAAGMASFINRYTYIYGTVFSGVCWAVAVASGGLGGAVCGALTAWIASAAAGVQGTIAPQGHHGVWAAYYWYPRYYTTGGYW